LKTEDSIKKSLSNINSTLNERNGMSYYLDTPMLVTQQHVHNIQDTIHISLKNK